MICCAFYIFLIFKFFFFLDKQRGFSDKLKIWKTCFVLWLHYVKVSLLQCNYIQVVSNINTV